MAGQLRGNSATSVAGVNSWTYVIQNLGLHTVKARINECPTSGLICTIAQSGSATVSIVAPAPSVPQQVINMDASLYCVPGDIITFSMATDAVSLSDIHSNDLMPNNVHATIVIRLGN